MSLERVKTRSDERRDVGLLYPPVPTSPRLWTRVRANARP
jgi:hypothetical protein